METYAQIIPAMEQAGITEITYNTILDFIYLGKDAAKKGECPKRPEAQKIASKIYDQYKTELAEAENDSKPQQESTEEEDIEVFVGEGVTEPKEMDTQNAHSLSLDRVEDAINKMATRNRNQLSVTLKNCGVTKYEIIEIGKENGLTNIKIVVNGVTLPRKAAYWRAFI